MQSVLFTKEGSVEPNVQWKGTVRLRDDADRAFEGTTLAPTKRKAEHNLRFRSAHTFGFLPREDQCVMQVEEMRKQALAK